MLLYPVFPLSKFRFIKDKTMTKQLTVIFDGKVFHPETNIDFKSNTRYLISILSEAEIPEKTSEDAWDILEDMAGTIEAPEDWSKEHDHYLYGTPKREVKDE
jgi:hypothetical protein